MHRGRRMLGAVLTVNLLAFVFFFAYAIYETGGDTVAPFFALRWQLVTALLDLFRWFPATQFLALAVALGSSTGRGDELVSASLLPAVLLSSALASFAGGLGPILEAQRSGYEKVTADFNRAITDADIALREGDLDTASNRLAFLQTVDRSDVRVAERAALLATAKAKAAMVAQSMTEGQKLPSGSARSLYLLALSLFDKGDWLEAHRNALAAYELDRSYIDAKRLAARAWEKAAGKMTPGPVDADEAAFFSRKLEGYSKLAAGDPLGAYAIFRELADGRSKDPDIQSYQSKHSPDPDVRRYLKESLEGMKKVAFFRDEADRAFAAFALGPIFIKLPVGKEGGSKLRFLSAREASWSGDVAFFRDFRWLDAGGSELIAGGTELAKLTNGKLFLVSVERERPTVAYRPSWSSGKPSISSVFDVALDPWIVYRVAAAQEAPEILSIPDAWRAAEEAPQLGQDQGPLILQLLGRSALPFSIFTAGALGVVAGVRFRRRKKTFPKSLYLLVPFMAAIVIPALVLVERLDSIIAAWALSAFPGFFSLVAAAGARSLFLLVAVLLLAGASNDSGHEESALAE